MNDIYIGAYWSKRKESIEQCSNRTKAMFTKLKECDDIFMQWYEKGISRKDALKRSINVCDDRQLATLFQKGRNRRDFDKTVIEDLGFRLSLWNGGTTNYSVSISIKCGLYSDNPNLSNAIVFNLPKELGQLNAPQKMLSVFASVVEAWEPDNAGVISRPSKDSRTRDPDAPFVDWMVYIAGKEVNPATLPKPSGAYPVAHGSIIVVQNEPVQFDNPEHIRNVHAVEKYLGLNPS